MRPRGTSDAGQGSRRASCVGKRNAYPLRHAHECNTPQRLDPVAFVQQNGVRADMGFYGSV